MKLLDLPQAEHFCRPSAADIAAVGQQSLPDFHASLSNKVTQLTEGDLNFKIHQINLLLDVDRWLLFSVAHYRRAVDMFVPASAPWAQVTLYYASFFAANAILGMLGGWTGHTKQGVRFVYVEHEDPGAQRLVIHRRSPFPSRTGIRGSHEVFWHFFYASTARISAWAPAGLGSALEPVTGNITWQIIERNAVNYDMYRAWEAAKRFNTSFRSDKLKTVSGPLQLQYETSEKLIKLALHFAARLQLSTTGLQGCGTAGTTVQVRRRLGAQQPPRLVSQSEFQKLLA